MLTLPDHFQELLTQIEPQVKRRTLAQEIPSKIRNYLKTCDKIQTVEPHSRLAGSYARHTAINDIKDVDIVLFVDNLYRDGSVENVLSALFSALHNLPEHLNDVGEVTVRRRQRRSINVVLERADLSLDIVPAVAINGTEKPLDIPDREWNKWVETHPLGYGSKLSELNDRHQDKVVRLIKLLKYWRDVQMSYLRPKSYWLECLVYNLIHSGTITTDRKSLAELFHDLLNAIDSKFSRYLNYGTGTPPIADPMLGHDVAHNWEREHFEAFMRNIAQSRNWAARALKTENEETAASLWQNIFGTEKFPNCAEMEGIRLRSRIIAGTLTVNGVAVRPQRFYGDEGE